MDSFFQLIDKINVDSILSDPLLLIGVTLFFLSFFIFIMSFIKWITTPTEKTFDFVIPHDNPLEPPQPVSSTPEPPFPTPSPPPSPEPALPTAPVEPPRPVEDEIAKVIAEAPTGFTTEKPRSFRERRGAKSAEDGRGDKTVVISPGEAEIQAQLDIIVTQIKSLNKKVSDLEDKIDGVEQKSPAKAEAHELKDAPKDASDLAKKLLKLAEHVIVLEKEMARLQGRGGSAPAKETSADSSPASSPSGKPPVMPL
ncbi:MAG: hypothetical protein LHV69_01885 [Elusimicrobia bacterium]|nr:hypothetical protein [Candidatus Obscuribacterium magneticum]